MASTPGTEDAHGLDKFFASTGEGVGDLGRRGVRDFATDDAVSFKLAELGGQHFFAAPRRSLRSSAKRFGLKPRCQMARTFHLPLTALMVPCTGQP